MQAVHTIGSSHVQRTARKRNYLAMSVAKKLAIPALLIFAFIFVVFIPTGADTLDNFVMSVGIYRVRVSAKMRFIVRLTQS